ncbi:MAG: carbohydrate binding family 9 domain-containing protein [Saprospiraceae bacterium]|nr:carbohydrate binding family 9 domain-containing protein [Saprospiraceae bacterium]
MSYKISKCIFVFLLTIIRFSHLSAQSNDSIAEQRTFVVQQCEIPPIIDGNLNDKCWKSGSLTSDFVQLEPKPFAPCRKKTNVQLIYDEENLYIGVMLFDDRDSISKEQSPRDEIGGSNTDYFVINFDTYNDKLNGFKFAVTSAGTQADAKIGSFNNGNGGSSNNDWNWNAVWESNVGFTDEGWIIEMKIPLFNLRFPKVKEQNWGFQCSRLIKRYGEASVWQGINPALDVPMKQWGKLTGLLDLKQSLRLSFTPYLACSADRIPQQNTEGKTTFNYPVGISGGMDIKYGINENFTLDATLIPDFSQVQSDARILNLSPFEIRFQENRPFFTEGTDLFNKTNIFYSRRVGGTPYNYYNISSQLNTNEVIVSNPLNTQLINASKFSGRTKSKYAFGIFNAVVGSSDATVTDTLTGIQRNINSNPLTNYNIAVAQKRFTNNSDITIINANTFRNGHYRDANVTGLDVNLRDNKNIYLFSNTTRVSQIFVEEGKTKIGFTNSTSFGKTSGNFGWNIYNESFDEKWDPNDLGIFVGNNSVFTGAGINYNTYKPNKIFLQSNWWLNAGYSTRWKPAQFVSTNLNFGFWGRFKNQSWANWWSYIQPTYSYDYFEPRVDGKKFRNLPYYNGGINIGTDNRKKLSSYFYIGSYKENRSNQLTFSFTAEPSLRLNNQFNISIGSSFYPSFNARGFTRVISEDEIIFAERNQKTIVNSAYLNYNPTRKTSMRLILRHYTSSVIVNKFFQLSDIGTLLPSDYSGNHDFNINFFNIDAFFQHEFQPGSFINISWKNNANLYEQLQNKEGINYFSSLTNILKVAKNNNITVKVVYFLEYGKMRSWVK